MLLEETRITEEASKMIIFILQGMYDTKYPNEIWT